MNIHEEQELVQKAVNDSLSCVQADPWLTQRVLAQAKGEKTVGKKISVSLVLVIILILVLSAAALAAGLGLFGQLSQTYQSERQLSALEEAAESIKVSMTTDDGITIEIDQAYYEGNRVFISYRLTGKLCSSELYEGMPDGSIHWKDTTENFIAAEQMTSDSPELQRLYLWLDGNGQRWGKYDTASLHDGLFLEDGTYLDILSGDNVIQGDGSIIGWKECEIPEDRLDDTLTFKAVLFRSQQFMFQDGSTFSRTVERGQNTDIFFTMKHNENAVFLKGSSKTNEYQAQAELISGTIDMKGTVHVIGPAAWHTAWENMDDDKVDMIVDWYLYQNETLLCQTGIDSIGLEGDNGLFYNLILPHLDNLDGLRLIPVYSLSEEHAGEGISIKEVIQ